MHKIFYENIFISDIITNKSLTIEEMLETVGFDEEAEGMAWFIDRNVMQKGDRFRRSLFC